MQKAVVVASVISAFSVVPTDAWYYPPGWNCFGPIEVAQNWNLTGPIAPIQTCNDLRGVQGFESYASTDLCPNDQCGEFNSNCLRVPEPWSDENKAICCEPCWSTTTTTVAPTTVPVTTEPVKTKTFWTKNFDKDDKSCKVKKDVATDPGTDTTCHELAECKTVLNSVACVCKKGLIGDGVTFCKTYDELNKDTKTGFTVQKPLQLISLNFPDLSFSKAYEKSDPKVETKSTETTTPAPNNSMFRGKVISGTLSMSGFPTDKLFGEVKKTMDKSIGGASATSTASDSTPSVTDAASSLASFANLNTMMNGMTTDMGWCSCMSVGWVPLDVASSGILPFPVDLTALTGSDPVASVSGKSIDSSSYGDSMNMLLQSLSSDNQLTQVLAFDEKAINQGALLGALASTNTSEIVTVDASQVPGLQTMLTSNNITLPFPADTSAPAVPLAATSTEALTTSAPATVASSESEFPVISSEKTISLPLNPASAVAAAAGLPSLMPPFKPFGALLSIPAVRL